jgi:Mg-chelatase subunit ChlI
VEVRPDSAGRADLRQAADPHLSGTYPFSAIVGQERLQQALLLNAVNPAVGGLLVEGPSGTAKSTAVRGLAGLLPELDVVGDCPFSCDPAAPCEACRARREHGEELPVVRRRTRVVTLPLNATDDRVAGSVDISRALREGVAALEPGLLAEVNRGILYVDEINLLDDHLVDILLDAAALGVNTVEREGVSVSHPARFLLIGTMNPEEGDLRPQLADRIGLRVAVDALDDAEGRAEVIRRREAYTADPDGFAAAWEPRERELAERLERGRAALAAVEVPDALYAAIGQVVVRAGVRSHRADVTILQCAKARAALDGRPRVEGDDVHDAASLALGHRVPIDPFDAQHGLDDRLLRRIVDEVLDEDAAEKKAAAPASPASSSSRSS